MLDRLHISFGFLWLAASALGGCALPARSPELRLHGERAVIVVEGEGTVESDALDCSNNRGPTSCIADVDELSIARVRPRAQPGWRFIGWRREVQSTTISPSFGGSEQVTYTARFQPETNIARNEQP